MRRCALNMSRYGIDRNLYEELRWFCKQYDDKRHRRDDARSKLSGSRMDGMPRRSGAGDPTSANAMIAQRYADDVAAIEQAISDTCDIGVRKAMLQHVAYDVPWLHLTVPVSRNTFYKLRRRFYFRLAQILGKVPEIE